MNGEQRAEHLRRLGRLGATGLILGALAGFGVSALVPAKYAATSDVLLTPTPGARNDAGTDARLLASYARLADGPQLSDAVRSESDSALTAGEIDDAITAEVVNDSTTIRIVGTHRDAETAAALSTAAAESLTKKLIDDRVATAPGTLAKDDGPTAQVSVSQRAELPASPSSPQRVQWAALGALIGMLFALIWTSLRQTTDRRIRSSAELAELTDLPLVGAFAYDRNAARQTLATDLDPNHPRFEAARIMRTNLQFLGVDQQSSVLTVTSAVPGEGKTTVSANVAVALARGGQSVLLVDGDLRRPRVASMFDVSASVGLTTALVGKVSPEKAVSATRVPGLDVLSSGTRPPNPAELLQTQAMSDLITYLSRQYDVVLIDAPPILPVTDAALLASVSDGALLVVRHSSTTREQLRTAMERLDAVNATLYGTVMTMVPARSGERYMYGYGYQAEPAPHNRSTPEGRRRR